MRSEARRESSNNEKELKIFSYIFSQNEILQLKSKTTKISTIALFPLTVNLEECHPLKKYHDLLKILCFINKWFEHTREKFIDIHEEENFFDGTHVHYNILLDRWSWSERRCRRRLNVTSQTHLRCSSSLSFIKPPKSTACVYLCVNGRREMTENVNLNKKRANKRLYANYYQQSRENKKRKNKKKCQELSR